MLPRDKRLKPYATELRKHATKQENRLWYEFLRHYRPHFYRQRIIDRYIADFYCPKARLVVELDGSSHETDDALVYDHHRTQVMTELGLRVIRFSDEDIDRRLEAVCNAIDRAVKERT